MKTTVTEQDVQEAIESIEYTKLGTKSCVALASLKNGFVIIEHASCVTPENYSEEVGQRICRERIEKKIWELLGFLLQQRLFEGEQSEQSV